MNEKEIGELRRRFRPEKSSITHVRGCYVNESGEIISQFDQSLALMTDEEAEKFLAVLRKTLSGSLGKNLNDITFDTRQVADSEEHRLLMGLRDSELKDEEKVQELFQKIISALDLEGNYLILLAHDSYDVPYFGKDGSRQDDAGSEVFRYILCSVCPVKETKPALSYRVRENEFCERKSDGLVSPPELGFLFPAFDDRSTNLYNALYYTKNSRENHAGFVEAVFRQEAPMPAEAQKETFQAILQESLEEECSFEVVRAVQDQLRTMVQEHKESKEREPLTISRDGAKRVLKFCGVSDEQAEEFGEKYDEAFGSDTDLAPANLVDQKQIEIKVPDVTIRVSPERSDLVETRILDGVKYVLIRAEGPVEMDGVELQVTEL